MLRTILTDAFRFLTFRPMGAAVREHRPAYLAFGLVCAWAAGIGRYWDNPRAEWWQAAGLGSVVYVFVLSGILCAILAPLRTGNASFANVLLFVALTSPPALFYAIPVERFLPPGDARAANAWFLALVAAWRVALYAVFLRRTVRLDGVTAAIVTVLPISLVIFALSILNLEHVVFQVMGGFRPGDASPNDDAYGVVVLLSILSWVAGPFAAIAYAMEVVRRRGA